MTTKKMRFLDNWWYNLMALVAIAVVFGLVKGWFDAKDKDNG